MSMPKSVLIVGGSSQICVLHDDEGMPEKNLLQLTEPATNTSPNSHTAFKGK